MVAQTSPRRQRTDRRLILFLGGQTSYVIGNSLIRSFDAKFFFVFLFYPSTNSYRAQRSRCFPFGQPTVKSHNLLALVSSVFFDVLSAPLSLSIIASSIDRARFAWVHSLSCLLGSHPPVSSS